MPTGFLRAGGIKQLGAQTSVYWSQTYFSVPVKTGPESKHNPSNLLLVYVTNNNKSLNDNVPNTSQEGLPVNLENLNKGVFIIS